MGDVIEAMAIRALYGEGPRVIGLKSYMGHTMGTCGAIELLLLLYMMDEGFVAPTLNLENVDKRCGGLRHVKKLEEAEVKTAALQNFAFGGVNTCVMVRRFDG
jgi:3-oxoacyl-[acyl-carrier-protein] synthase II